MFLTLDTVNFQPCRLTFRIFFLQLLHTLLINDMKHTWNNHFNRLFHACPRLKKNLARNFLKTFFINKRYYLTFFYKCISNWLYKFESLIKLTILNIFKLYLQTGRGQIDETCHGGRRWLQ